MKIYSYLASGRAVLATDLPTHTQVLDSNVAMLIAPCAPAMAAGMIRLIGDPGLRAWLGAAARQLAESTYSRKQFNERLISFYERIEVDQGSRRPGAAPGPRGRVARLAPQATSHHASGCTAVRHVRGEASAPRN